MSYKEKVMNEYLPRTYEEQKKILLEGGWTYKDDRGWISSYESRRYPTWWYFDEYVQIKAEELGWTKITTVHYPSMTIDEETKENNEDKEGWARWERYQHPISKKIYDWDDMFQIVTDKNNDDSNYIGNRISQIINNNVNYKAIEPNDVIYIKHKNDGKDSVVIKILKTE